MTTATITAIANQTTPSGETAMPPASPKTAATATINAISNNAPMAILPILAKNSSGATLSIDRKKIPPAAKIATMLIRNCTSPEPDMMGPPLCSIGHEQHEQRPQQRERGSDPALVQTLDRPSEKRLGDQQRAHDYRHDG